MKCCIDLVVPLFWHCSFDILFFCYFVLLFLVLGHGPIVEYLLEKGVSPNVTNGDKVTPIKIAVAKGGSQ